MRAWHRLRYGQPDPDTEARVRAELAGHAARIDPAEGLDAIRARTRTPRRRWRWPRPRPPWRPRARP